MKKPVVIIPSIRTIEADRIAAIPEDVDIFVVDDSDGSIRPSRDRMKVFTYADQRELMGKDYDLIPHKTAACRNFAFYYVYRHTDHDVVITLDDDVFCPPDFMASYSVVGTDGEFPNVTVEGDGWYNTIAHMGVRGSKGETLYPRGFPYWLRHPLAETRSRVRGRVTCIMGLWSNVLDYDGLDKYLFEDYRALHQEVSLGEPLLTVGAPARPTKFSFCAMNFAFHRDMLPAAYQMPMDREIAPGYPIWRFDDIWAGYVIEALVHKRGGADLIGIGAPVGTHLKEGNLVREVHGEHYGHLMSPYFYGFIDAGVNAIRPGTYAAMYFDLFTHLVDHFGRLADEIRCPPLYRSYFIETFERLQRWGALFDRGDSAGATRAIA
jgi:Reversibly glycosylated polypeptide